MKGKSELNLLKVVMVCIVAMLLTGCRALPPESAGTGTLSLDLQSAALEHGIASLVVELVDRQNDTIVEYKVQLNESGLVFIDKIPVGNYYLSIIAIDNEDNPIYETDRAYYTPIAKGTAYLNVTLVPLTGALAITVRIVEPNPPEESVTTTITGRVVGDGKHSVAGTKIGLYQNGRSGGRRVEVGEDGLFELKDQMLALSEDLNFSVGFSPPESHENYYEWLSMPLQVDGDMPDEFDLGDVALESNSTCIHVKLHKAGVPPERLIVNLKLMDISGDVIYGGGRTNDNGEVWSAIHGPIKGQIEIEINGMVILKQSGTFLSRNTYSYTIDLGDL